MNLKSARDRYLKDAHFHQLVSALEKMIHELQFTPSEIREAAIFAAIRVDERKPFEQYFNEDYK